MKVGIYHKDNIFCAWNHLSVIQRTLNFNILRFVDLNQISRYELEVQVVFFEMTLLGKDQFQSYFHQIFFLMSFKSLKTAERQMFPN